MKLTRVLKALLLASVIFVPSYSTISQQQTLYEVNLEDFTGADCTGLTESTTAFINAVNWAMSVGTRLHICQGPVKVNISTPISLTTGIDIYGDGGRLSQILNTNTSGSLFRIATTDAVYIRDVGFKVVGTPTGGTMISDDGLSGNGTANMNQKSRFINITCDNIWNCIDLQHSAGYTIRDGDFDNIYGTAIKVQNLANEDWGDSTITGNDIHLGQGASCTATTNVGIDQYGSGGLRITNNKINCGGIHYRLKAGGGGKTVVSSVLLVYGNSFENCQLACVQLTHASSLDKWTNVIIADNEIAPYASGVSNISITGTTVGWIKNVSITGNVLVVASNASGIYVGYGDAVLIDGNIITPQNGSSGNYAYALQNTATHCMVSPNNIITGLIGFNNCSAP